MLGLPPIRALSRALSRARFDVWVAAGPARICGPDFGCLVSPQSMDGSLKRSCRNYGAYNAACHEIRPDSPVVFSASPAIDQTSYASPDTSLADMEISNREQADSLIAEIREETGGVTQDDIDFLEKHRPSLLKCVLSLREQLGESAKLLAEKLYGNNRFLYELIQNADDNLYPPGESAALSITLREDTLEVDSNETGFTPADIKAICSIGESTKARKEGFIGEKGIGFKSVFQVAEKVHIQSEPFSFAFNYRRQDKRERGLGMATPLVELRKVLPSSVKTRVTLHLRDGCNWSELRDELLGLSDTLLLFMRKLKRITVRIEMPNAPLLERKYSLKSPAVDSTRFCVTVQQMEDTQNLQEDSYYLVRKRQIFDMPKDEARPGRSAEVVLAFPIDENYAPVVRNRYVHAFLPIADYRFKAGFVTQTNREGVLDSPWNRKLRLEIAETFMEMLRAPDGFLGHESLKYTWLRYLPHNIVSHFWNVLELDLLSRCRQSSCVIDRFGRTRRPSDLRIVTPDYLDYDNQPLFMDLGRDRAEPSYLAEEYHDTSSLEPAKRLGVSDLLMGDFLERVKYDVSPDNLVCSRMKTETSSQWHSSVAKRLFEAIQDGQHKHNVQLLAIVPLMSGAWSHSLKVSIHLPTSGECAIPAGLPIAQVAKACLANQDRRRLFGALGIEECPPSEVIKQIQQRYTSDNFGKKPYLAKQLQQDIGFLFWHNDKVPNDGFTIKLGLASSKGCLVCNSETSGRIYCAQSDEPYATCNLLGGKVPGELKGVINFPHSIYYEALGLLESKNGMSPVEWFRKQFDIHTTPHLLRDDNFSLSRELLYIAETLPDKLLGVLKANEQYLEKPEPWTSCLEILEVPVLASNQLITLSETYAPLPSLKAHVAELDLMTTFTFLRELDGMTDLDVFEWRFLEILGVGLEANTTFWLDTLRAAAASPNFEQQNVFKIYHRLQRCAEEQDIETLRNAFEESDLVYIPKSEDFEHTEWVQVSQCLWSAPEWYDMEHKLSSFEGYQQLYSFFRIFLELEDVSVDNYLDYLSDIKVEHVDDDNSVNIHKISLIYEELEGLAKENSSGAAKSNISHRMERELLIYHPQSRSWIQPSICIWAEDDLRLPDKYSVATAYQARSHFFRNILCIEKPDLEMHVKALMKRASSEPVQQEMYQDMLCISVLDPKPGSLKDELASCQCLPVRKTAGPHEWVSPNVSDLFSIIDRQEHSMLFQDKIATLDFSLEEMHAIRSFILALAIEGRYTSKTVTEATQVAGGTIHQSLTFDLQQKSYAIARYAAHIGAANPLVIHSRIQQAKVFTSSGITKVVQIIQNGTVTSIEGETANFHLEQIDNQLNLYIPSDRQQRHLCLTRHLPVRLLRHFGVSSAQGAMQLSAIIQAPDLHAVEAILQHDGIIGVPGIDTPDLTASEQPVLTPEVDDHELADSILVVARNTPFGQNIPQPALDYARNEESRTYFPSPPNMTGPRAQRPDLYAQLLGIVITQAAAMLSLPQRGASIMASESRDVDWAAAALAPHMSDQQRFLIGAAGELFVFEMLKQMGLPDFGEDCWPSSIRDLVKCHPSYSHLTVNRKREAADIIYDDVEGALTNILIRQGYLDAAWVERKPRYFIEVKTTMSSVETPFICTHSQWERMENMQLADSNGGEVYIIARVFNLGAARMGLQLYLDPATLRSNGELRFWSKSYFVEQA